MFESPYLSLEVWHRLLARVQSEFSQQKTFLLDAFSPVPVSIETGAQFLTKGEGVRNEIKGRASDLGSLLLLELMLTNQLRISTNTTDIPFLMLRRQCLRDTADLLEQLIANLPSRSAAEAEFQHIMALYTGMKNAGAGDQAAQERQRVRAQVFKLPVFGQEDGTKYRDQARRIRADVDDIEAEIQKVRANTTMLIRVDEELAAGLASFGVTMTPVPEAPEQQQTSDAAA